MIFSFFFWFFFLNIQALICYTIDWPT